MGRLSELRLKLERKKGKRDQILDTIDSLRSKAKKTRREHRDAEKAQALIQVVAQQTQEELQYQLSELPRLALAGVFDNPYDFEVAFELRRGKTEADFWFIRADQRMNPKESTGLGAVDIAGAALRPSLWSLRRPRNRACIFLDEPFKHLKGEEANKRALEMLKGICRPRPERGWPGLQIIMIADERAPREELLKVADSLFEFKLRGKRSVVTQIKGGAAIE